MTFSNRSAISLRYPLLLLLGTLMLTGCEDKAAPAKTEVVRPVKTTIVEAPSLDRTRVFPGKVEAANKVDLAFQVAGALTQLPVKKGQNVTKGELLAQLDKRDYRSDLKAAQAEHTRAQADYQRAEKIFKKRLISASDVDRLKAARQIAAANVEKSRKALNDTSLRAPFSGTIATLYVDNFQDVRAKDPVLSLQDNSALDISVQVPENLIVRAGRQNHDIDLVARLEAYPDKAFPLSIKEFSTEADPDTQTFEFVLSMPAPTEINVLPGMSVSVEATPKAGTPESSAGSPAPVLIKIPATAVFAAPDGQNQQFVWIYDAASQTVNRREVSIGRLSGSRVEIRSGLEAGERVVTAGVHYLLPGQKVRLFKAKAGVI